MKTTSSLKRPKVSLPPFGFCKGFGFCEGVLLVAAALCCLTVGLGCSEVSSSDYREYTRPEAGSQENTADTSSSGNPKITPNGTNPSDTPPSTGSLAAGSQANGGTGTAPLANLTVPKTADSAAAESRSQNPGTLSIINDDTPVRAKKPLPPVRVVQVLVKERNFQVVGPEKAIRVTYDDIDLIKILNMEPVTPNALSLMPGWLKNLDGKRIRLRGFMFPAFSETGLTGFGFARDNDICCFIREPKIYDVFEVRMREGETTHYIDARPFDVVGVFHFLPDSEDWDVRGMYRIDDATVIDK